MGHRISTAHRFGLLLATGFALTLLAGCGEDGSQGPAGAAGSAPVTNATGLSTAQQKALSITGTVDSITIASKPVVRFTLKDASGKGITGLGHATTTVRGTTYAVPTLTNIQFALAKLVPADAATGSPSKWVSYIVTSVPTAAAPTVVGLQRPSTDATGTLVDHGNGSYTYTFYRDIALVAGVVAGSTDTATNLKADLGDTSYEPNRIHRLVIQVGGDVRGTGSNTADGVQVTPSVPMNNPVNIVYDFIPATGAVVSASDANGREIVKVSACMECHTKFTWHGGVQLKATPGTRQDTRYCVVCHNDQRKYGRTEAATTATGYSGSTYRIDGQAVGNLPLLVHKIHMGDELTKTGYNFANVLFNEVTYPQDRRNCVRCHDGTTGAANATAQGDNWKNKPSRLACVACHDNVNYTTGAITPVGGGGATAHSGGDWSAVTAPDSTCANSGCHTSTEIAAAHLPVALPNRVNSLTTAGASSNTNAAWVAGYLDNLPAGAIKITYDVQSVGATSNRPYIVFKFKADGTDVVFNDPASATEMMNNFVGSPSAYFVFAVPQDGNNTPADFNASVSGYLKKIWNGTATGTGAGTMTGPDGSGYYTVTLTGVTIPATATMLTGGIGFSYSLSSAPPLTQTNLTSYPYPDPAQVALATTNGIAGAGATTGGLIVQSPVQWKVATGHTGRRNIVETARCTECHAQLGVKPAFHAGERNDAQTCNWCHTANRASSGWSARSNNFVHAIHSGAKRTAPFTWHASTAAPAGFSEVTFPGILRKCETCHLPGMYDFSNSAYTDALMGRLLFTTVATGTYSAAGASNPSLSPYVDQTGTVNYGSGFSYAAATGVPTNAATTTLVTSPIATACFACHDSTTAMAHMRQNGASIYAARSTILSGGVAVSNEQCLLCHGPGKIAAIADMHGQ